MAENALDGFDHTQYSDEVAQRWGQDAADASDAWWRGQTEEERRDWKAQTARLNAAWIEAAEAGIDPTGERGQQLAEAHVSWLRSVPGIPSADQFAGYVRGLGEMYVADPRFAVNYGGQSGAEFVRDALATYVERELS